jgi:hypothetical protein
MEPTRVESLEIFFSGLGRNPKLLTTVERIADKKNFMPFGLLRLEKDLKH